MQRIISLLLIVLITIGFFGLSGCTNHTQTEDNKTVIPNNCYVATSGYGVNNLNINSSNHTGSFDWTIDNEKYRVELTYSDDNLLQEFVCYKDDSLKMQFDVEIKKDEADRPVLVTITDCNEKIVTCAAEYYESKLNKLRINYPDHGDIYVTADYVNDNTVLLQSDNLTYYLFKSLKYVGLVYYDNNIEDGYPDVVLNENKTSVEIEECNLTSDLQLMTETEAKMFEQWTTVYMLLEAFD